jgi:hypothetical protein
MHENPVVTRPCHVERSEPYNSSRQAHQLSKYVHFKVVMHSCAQQLTEMPIASVQGGSTGNGSGWLKELALLEAGAAC